MLRQAVFPVILLTASSQLAPDIDLVNIAPKNRVREPASVSSSGGQASSSTQRNQELPLVVKVLSANLEKQSSGVVLEFEIEVRNIAGAGFELPVDPNLIDFEPTSSSTPYSYRSAYITPVLDHLRQGKEVLLSGFSLYGSERVRSSLRMLGPSETVRIRAALPVKSLTLSPRVSEIPDHLVVRADLLLQIHAVEERHGVLHEDSQQTVPQIVSSNFVDLGGESPAQITPGPG